MVFSKSNPLMKGIMDWNADVHNLWNIPTTNQNCAFAIVVSVSNGCISFFVSCCPSYDGILFTHYFILHDSAILAYCCQMLCVNYILVFLSVEPFWFSQLFALYFATTEYM